MLLHDKLKDYRLILASQSPRRRQLLTGCDLPYELAGDYEVEEKYPPQLPAEDVPIYLSKLKSEAYPHALDEKDILITADTVVIVGAQIVGKPADRTDAIRILQLLSGRSHRVITGVTLRSQGRGRTFDARSEVFFRSLSLEEITYYVDKYQPYDKAGAYGIQEWIGYIGIERIEGSFYNVMGLPVQRLHEELNKFISL